MRTYRRLMGFLRPYRLSLWGSLAFAWAAMGMTVLIPWLVGRAVNAIEAGNKADLLPLALAIFGAAILRMGLTVGRRLVAGRVSLGVEYDLRNLLYAPAAAARARLLRPPPDRPADVARDRRPAGGPLLPRLRADLHRPVGAHDRARGRRDVRRSSRSWPRSRCSRSRSWSASPTATAASRARRCRRSSSRSPS